MSENDYTFDTGESLLSQILAKKQGTTTPVSTTTGTMTSEPVAQQTQTTPAYNLSTMTPQQVHEYMVSNPGGISQAELDQYAQANNLGAPPTGGVPYSPTGTNDIATGQSITTTQPNTTGTTYNPSDLISLFDSLLNSSQGTSALGEIASGTGTTTATTGEQSTTDDATRFKNLLAKGIDVTKYNGIGTNTGASADDYSLYYSTKNRGTQV